MSDEAPAPKMKWSASEETLESLRLQRDALVDALADTLDPSMAEWLKTESHNMHVPAIATRKVHAELKELAQEAASYRNIIVRMGWHWPRAEDVTMDNLPQRVREALADAKADGMEEAAGLVPKAAALVLKARAEALRREVRKSEPVPPKRKAKR